MASSDLVFQVRAQTSGAVAGFKRLASSLKPVEKDATAASKSLDKISKTKVSPKVEDKQVAALNKEIQRLQDSMRHALTMDVHADTRGVQRQIRQLQSAARALSRTPASPSPTRLDRFKSVLSEVTAGIGRFGSAAGSAFKAISVPVLGTIAAGILGIGTAIGVTVVKALELADSFQRTTLQIDSFVRNMSLTKDLLADVQKFADTTSFEFPELALASKMLLGLGRGTNKIVPQLKKLGDVASQAGTSVSDLTRIYAQMVSAGRLNAGDMNQLVNQGINAWPILAKSMGLTVAQVRELSEQGKIGTKEIEAFWDALAKGAKGSTAAIGKTLGGQISTLKDTFNGVLRDLGAALTPFAQVIVPQITAATKGLGDRIMASIPGWIDALATLGQNLLVMGANLLSGLKSVTVGFLTGISTLQSALGEGLTAFGGFANQLAGMAALFGPAGLAMASSLRDIGTGLETAGAGMKDAAATTAGAAVKAGENWDKWIAAYKAGAARASSAIERARLKAQLTIKTGEAQKEVTRLEDKLARLKRMKPTPEVRAKIDKAERALKRAKTKLDQLNSLEVTPEVDVKSNAAAVARATTRFLNGIQDETVWIYVKERSLGGFSPNQAPGSGPGGAPPLTTQQATMAAQPQVTVAVRDEKLADLVDIRVNNRAARTAKIVHRRGRITL